VPLHKEEEKWQQPPLVATQHHHEPLSAMTLPLPPS